ncbi:MAG: sugar ABC transporter ATP-binding protein [Acetivibrionales bacterium]|jgi:ribose transport system ATP-binding protein
MQDYILEVEHVSKEFPGVKALDDVSFKVRYNEVHALIGENGAGKSTLMKILNGNYRRDSGTIKFNGNEVEITSPNVAHELGISIIFQELNLVPSLTVAENIYLGRLKEACSKGINWNEIHMESKKILDRIGCSLDTHRLVEGLSIADMQMVEIAKALSYKNTKLILMDEPSAPLTEVELEKLFKIVKDLKESGVSVVYISHKLKEVFEICDHATILRDGCIIDSQPVSSLNEDIIVEKMIGREITNKFPKRENVAIGEEVLRVENISRKGVLNNISFSLRKGEVLGIAGLVGAGRTELARAIFGVDFIDSGKITINGQVCKVNSPSNAIKKRLAYLSEDRKGEGLVGNTSVMYNLTMVNLEKIKHNGILNKKKEKELAKKNVEDLNIKPPHLRHNVMNLSGGNQQKIVVGKWLNTHAQIFIFDEPTRGIDVGSKYEIFVLINKLVAEGNSVILISSELPEVLNMSDRVLVMSEGSIRAELVGSDITAENFIKSAI